MNIRLLIEQDLSTFYALRLRGLQESPEAFGMTEEFFLQMPPSQIAGWLHSPSAILFSRSPIFRHT